MELKAFFVSLMDFDEGGQSATLHVGMAAEETAEKVTDTIREQYCDPRYITVQEVRELRPIMEDGCCIGYEGRENNPQANARPVDNGGQP